MLILAIDAATEIFTAALSEDEKIIAEVFLDTGLRHSENIIKCTDFLLKRAGCKINNLDGIAVGLGPGSLTGIRTSLAFAKTFCQLRGKKLFGISTLDIIAHTSETKKNYILPIITASKNEIFTAVYEYHQDKLRRISNYKIFKIKQFLEFIKKLKKDVVILKTSPKASILAKISLQPKYKRMWRNFYKVKPIYLKEIVKKV